MTSVLDRDHLNAFCRHTHVEREGAASGVLAGLTFGAKDVYDVVGVATGFGSPDWLRTHGPAEHTASAVQRLLDAGARLVGKTQTDELTYSLNGENAHYGTPVNPRAPGRIPGGSSSGSAAAVAGGLCDFALGSDTGGSVRIPASYCGVLGMRPSHGRIALDGARPLAPSFDTAGWFAASAELMERVGRVLLGDASAPIVPTRLLVARDAFELAGSEATAALAVAVTRIGAHIGDAAEIDVGGADLGVSFEAFRVLQAGEVWQTHGEWVTRTAPDLGPGIKERFAMARAVTREEIADAERERQRVTARMDALLPPGTMLCLPTAPGIAPHRDTPGVELNEFRVRALSLLCLAGLARLPQLSLPLGTLDGCPIGLSLVAGRGEDLSLLAVARAVAG